MSIKIVQRTEQYLYVQFLLRCLEPGETLDTLKSLIGKQPFVGCFLFYRIFLQKLKKFSHNIRKKYKKSIQKQNNSKKSPIIYITVNINQK